MQEASVVLGVSFLFIFGCDNIVGKVPRQKATHIHTNTHLHSDGEQALWVDSKMNLCFRDGVKD